MAAIENTSNRGGGSYFTFKQMQELRDVCREKKLYYHIDGARIFNALVETGDDPAEVGKLFDTVSICLSKGLGAPVGSLLIASRDRIKKARKIRKAFGGGMRQAGFLAAAGIYALDHHITRLKDDHRRAKEIGNALAALPFMEKVLPVATNIVIFRLKPKVTAEEFRQYLLDNGIKCNITEKQTIRMVTHLDINDSMVEKVAGTIKKYSLQKINS
jgi:threonine aldolase